MENCVREGESTKDEVSSGNKKLDDQSKASLKAALGSMLLVVGLVGAEGAFATTTLPTIVVTATPSDPGGPVTVSPCPTNDAVRKGVQPKLAGCGSGNPGPVGGGGSGGAVTLSEIKVTATAIKCQIEHLSYNNNEYLAFAYLNSSGSITISSLINGKGTVSVSLSSLGIPTNSVLTMVHNHPINIYGSNSLNYIPSKADWISYSNIQGAGGPITGQFIVGPDGVLRYFDGTNKNYPATYQYPASGGTLPVGQVVNGGC